MVGGCKPNIGHNSNSTLGGVELTWSGDGVHILDTSRRQVVDGVGLEWRWSWELSWSLAISNLFSPLFPWSAFALVSSQQRLHNILFDPPVSPVTLHA